MKPDYAVIIGLNLYKELEALSGAVNDAEAFLNWVQNPRGGGFSSARGDKILKILSPAPADWNPDTPHPNSTELEQVLGDLLAEACSRNRPIGTRLFLFLAGHGFNDRDKLTDVALYSPDHNRYRPAFLAASWYAREFQRIGAFEQIALIMDCCRDTSPFHPVTPPPHIHMPSDENARKVKMFVAMASGYTRPAGEKVIDGKTYGVFSSALMQALEKAPANRQGRLTGSLVKKYTHLYMETQDADIDADANKEFVFIENHQAGMQDAKLHIANLSKTVVVKIFDHENTEVRTISAESSPVQFKLPPGYYKAKIPGTNRSTLFQVPTDEHTEI